MNVACSFDLMVDPLSIGTPQHKKHTLCRGRLLTYPDPKVARARRVMALLAKTALAHNGLVLPPSGTPVRLELTMFYAIPKNRRADHHTRAGETIPRLCGGDPCTSHACGDVDNKAKGIIDALTDAGCWVDDKDVTCAQLRKCWTEATPRIRVIITPDKAGSDDLLVADIRENERLLEEDRAAGRAPVDRPTHADPDPDTNPLEN